MRYADKVGPRLRESDVPCVNHGFSHAILHSTFLWGSGIQKRAGLVVGLVEDGASFERAAKV